MQRFFVQELCDVYIEFSKPVLYGNRLDADEFGSRDELQARKLSAQATLFQCLDYSMRLLHPFIPFVTEELWCVRLFVVHVLSGTSSYRRRLPLDTAPVWARRVWVWVCRQRIREHDPFKTEALSDTSILFAKYPEESEMSAWVDEDAERAMLVRASVRKRSS